MKSYSVLAFQFTLDRFTFPGYMESKIWQYTAPEPSCSILLILICVRQVDRAYQHHLEEIKKDFSKKQNKTTTFTRCPFMIL